MKKIPFLIVNFINKIFLYSNIILIFLILIFVIANIFFNPSREFNVFIGYCFIVNILICMWQITINDKFHLDN